MKAPKLLLCLALLMANILRPASLRADESRYITPNLLTVAGRAFSSADDSVSSALNIGFTFRYAGVDYTTVQMSTNGVLYFANGTNEWTNDVLTTRTGTPGVYALWDDLFVGNSSDETLSRALYYTTGTVGSRVFIMQWTNWYSYSEPYEVGTFNVVLHEGSNQIDIYYRNMLGTSALRQYGNSATIGLAAANGYTSQYSMNSPVATEGKLLTYTPSAGGASPYSLQDRTVTAATAAALQTYFLSYTSSPQIPVNLSAAPSTPDATSATLTWDLSALGATPTGYNIRYATNAQMTSFVQTSSFTTPGTYVLSGLSAGTTYYWQVVATIGSLTSVATTSSFTQVVNHAPVAVDGTLSTAQNIPFSGVLSATDVDNSPTTSGLIYSVVTQPASGAVAITNSATGTYTYTPVNGFGGPVSFTFKAFDGTSYSNLATVSGSVMSGPTIGVEQPAGSPLAFSPAATVDFGSVGISSTISTQTFTIRNTGTANLTTSGVVVTGANAADYVITSAATFPVAPLGSTMVTVMFSPSASGPRAATLSIPSNDTSHTPFTVSLTGSGTTIATLIVSTSALSYTVNTPAVIVDPGLIITGTGTLTGASISITGNLVPGLDQLNFSSQAGITGSYNATSGILTLSGSATLADYQAAMRSVTFSSSSSSTATRSFTLAIGQSLFNPGNAHSYEFVAANGISWQDAQAAAAARTFFGMHGYLVTVTSASEQAFVQTKLAGQGWMGASDAANEGEWFWVTGPEAGTQFWHGLGSAGYSVNGNYSNWSTGEPNDAGNEDYAHFLVGGMWNDYAYNNPSIQGYVVEYGGLPSDPLLQLTGTRSATIQVPAIAVHNGALVSDLAVANGGSVAFGSSVVGTGLSRSITIQNTGAGSLTGLTVTQGGSNAAEFVAGTITAPVAANGSTTFNIVFTPAGAGTRTAALHIASNDPLNSPFDINVSGVGTITLNSVTVPGAGTYKESSILTFTATYSQAVTVSGLPSLDFVVGTTLRHATYAGGSGTTTLTFTYTVVSADMDTDGIAVQSPLSLNGGAILDPAGNAAPRAFTPPSTSGVKVGGDIYFTSTVNAAPNATTSTPGIGVWESIRSGMVISGTGALAFRGHLDLDPLSGVSVDNFQGIWKSPLGTSASTVLVTRTGAIAPDTGSAVWDVLPENPYINNAAQITFAGFLRVNTGTPAVTTSSDSGVWSELGGNGMHKMLREGEAVAGGIVATVAPSGWIATSDTGLATFAVKLRSGLSALVKATAASGSFNLSTVARQGDAAPTLGGVAAGTFDVMNGNNSDPRMNAAGDLAFSAYLASGGSGIWYEPAAGTLSAVVRDGLATPGLADTFYAFDRPSLSSGTIFFRAFLTTTGQSIWKGNPAAPAALTAIAKTGDTALPGIPAGSQLWSLFSPFSNANARVAFRATLMSSTSVETRAIVTDTDGTLKVIAKIGDIAPGTSGQTFVNFDNPVIGDGDQTAFVGATSGGVVGIWRQAANGGALKLLMRVGDTVNAGGVDEIITQIIVPGGASADRLSEVKTVDATGRVMAHVTYVSGKTGILLTSP